MRAAIVLVCGLAGACASPLQSLRTDVEARSAFKAVYHPPAERSSCAPALAHIESRAAMLGLTITYLDLSAHPGLAGRAKLAEKAVLINKQLASCGRLEVLAHEIAHHLQPIALDIAGKQVFADGVSFEVVRRLAGYEPKTRYAQYLARFKSAAYILTLYAREIRETADMLTGSGETRE